MRHLRPLLVFAARRPLAALLVPLLALAITAGLVSGALLGGSEEPAGSPRMILGRVWFDKYPEKRADEIQILIFLGGGIGLYERGSGYRAAFDIFEFERQGDRVLLTFLHDKKRAETKFTVQACDERPPFNLCLDLADSPRGPKRYYGFGDEDDMAREIPWSRGMLRAAESRAGVR
jgi:hypothetical protein